MKNKRVPKRGDIARPIQSHPENVEGQDIERSKLKYEEKFNKCANAFRRKVLRRATYVDMAYVDKLSIRKLMGTESVVPSLLLASDEAARKRYAALIFEEL